MEKLPTKTKIAAGMLKIIGIIGIIATISAMMLPIPSPDLAAPLALVAPFLFLSVFGPIFLLSLFILCTLPSFYKKDKKAWKKIVLLASVLGIMAISGGFLYIMESAFYGGAHGKIAWDEVPFPLAVSALFFIPFILILSDRKEFFEKEELSPINKFIIWVSIGTIIATILIGVFIYLWQAEYIKIHFW
jgi:hypothetical protein